MGRKRDLSEMDPKPSEEAAANSEEGDPGSPWKKKRRGQKSHKAREGTFNWAKKRARTIERKLRHQELPANVRNELERELAAHQGAVEAVVLKKKKRDMVKKYHMVRFFEKQKARRLAKQLQQKIEDSTDPDEVAKLQADLHIAEVDAAYAQYFPYLERYVSLYPTGPKAETSSSPDLPSAKAALHGDRPKLWPMVEKLMEKGTDALEKFRERRLEVDSHAKTPPPRPSKHSFTARAHAATSPYGTKGEAGSSKGQSAPKPGRKRKSQDHESDAGSDGGGFFEED